MDRPFPRVPRVPVITASVIGDAGSDCQVEDGGSRRSPKSDVGRSGTGAIQYALPNRDRREIEESSRVRSINMRFTRTIGVVIGIGAFTSWALAQEGRTGPQPGTADWPGHNRDLPSTRFSPL